MTAQRLYLSEPLPPVAYGRVYKENGRNPEGGCAKDKENYDYLLNRCDDYAKRHHGRIRGVVDYEHWDAHIDLYLRMLEFDDAEDMSFVKDIGEKRTTFASRRKKAAGTVSIS